MTVKRTARLALFLCFAALLTAPRVYAGDPSHFVKLDEMPVHYEAYGTGKEAVVFIHGWTCDLTFWRGQAPFYEKRRSLLIDLPGHGQSGKPEIAYTQDLFARSVDAAMRDAGIEKAVLVGHSMGTPVALTFLEKYPATVSGLVIVDGFIPQPPKDDEEKKKRAAQAAEMSKTWRSPNYKDSLDRMLEFMFTSQTPPALRDEIRAKMLAAPNYVRASALEEIMALEPPKASFDVPAIAIMVKRDSQSGYEEYLHRLFPNLRSYQAWEGAGHFLMMEQPERFNKALSDFVDAR